MTKNLKQFNNNNRIKKRHKKVIESKRQPNNLKHALTSSKLGECTMNGVSKCKNKIHGVCNIIISGKSYTFENPK